MRKKIVKNLLAFAMLSLLLLPAIAAKADIDVGVNEITNGFGDNGLSNTDPRVTVAKIINVALLFLGIIAVVIILAGGFKWMTAGGNEDKVGEAKKLMGAGIIGMVIVLSAWGIARFILDNLISATGNN